MSSLGKLARILGKRGRNNLFANPSKTLRGTRATSKVFYESSALNKISNGQINTRGGGGGGYRGIKRAIPPSRNGDPIGNSTSRGEKAFDFVENGLGREKRERERRRIRKKKKRYYETNVAKRSRGTCLGAYNARKNW